VFWFPLQLFSEAFLFLCGIQRDIIINADCSLRKVPVIFVRFVIRLEFARQIFSKNPEILNLIKICQVGAELPSKNTKILTYKVLIRPLLTYASETWTVSKANERRLSLFEWKLLRCIFGAQQENEIWRKRYNYELYEIFNP